jgi:hypothetical protein
MRTLLNVVWEFVVETPEWGESLTSTLKGFPQLVLQTIQTSNPER